MSDIHRIQILLAAADHSSFRKAAEHLGISQPAVTKSIRRLEAELGFSIFDRTNKAVILTPIGRVIVDRCRDVQRQYQEMIREVNLLAGLESGQISLGAGPIPAETFLGPAIGRVLLCHPNLCISVKVDNWYALSDLLLRNEIDLYVADVEELPHADKVHVIELPQESGVWCCSPKHPLLGRREVFLSDLKTYPILGPRLPTRIRAVFRRAGMKENPLALQSPHMSLLLGIVIAGNAITIVPDSFARPWIDRGDIRTFDIVDVALRTNYGIVVRKDRTLPFAVEAIIQELKAVCEERDRSVAQRSSGQRGTVAER
jgi:DNA-binding transcriptional LysR family regulator